MPITLVPTRKPPSHIGRVLGWIAAPWALGLLFGADTLLTAAGLPPGPERPAITRALIVVAAVAPGLLWWFAPSLSALPGLAWLVEATPPTLTLDDVSMTLTGAGGATRTVRWDEIARVIAFEGWPPSARLVLRDGSHLDLPGELVRPTGADGRPTTFLAEIEGHRPDIVNVAAHRRRGLQVTAVILVVLIGLGMVAILILASRT